MFDRIRQRQRSVFGLLVSVHSELYQFRTETRTSLRRMEKRIMSVRDEFNEALAGLGQAIVELDNRIQNLPADRNDVTQEDIDTIRGLSSQMKSMAVSAPEVPTDLEATEDENRGQDPSTEQTFGTGYAGQGQSNA